MTAPTANSSALRPGVVVARRFARERRTLTAGVTIGGMLVLWLQISLYPSVRDSFAEMAGELPEFFEQLVGSGDFTTPEGFLQAEAFGSMAPILVVIAAVSTAAASLAGSEKAGTMSLLATTGVRRRTIALAGASSMALAVTVVVAGYWFAVATGSAIGGLDIALSRVTAACISLWALGVAIGGIAFAAGAATGRRGAALGAGSVVAIASYLTYSLLPLAESLAWGRYVSLWYPYADHQPLWNGLSLLPLTVLLAIAAGMVALGVAAFRRRDIG